MPDWDEDGERLFDNLKEAYRAAREEARARRPPDIGQARRWHALTMAGLTVPDAGLAGAFLGEPGLEGYEVSIGVYEGVPASEVADALTAFEARLRRAAAALDGIVLGGAAPADADELNAVIELCAWVHSEWVRIHPFANGNGRTARIWAGYIAMRYGLPPFVRLRPRPDGGYGAACARAMEGEWAPTAAVFRQMYLKAVAGT